MHNIEWENDDFGISHNFGPSIFGLELFLEKLLNVHPHWFFSCIFVIYENSNQWNRLGNQIGIIVNGLSNKKHVACDRLLYSNATYSKVYPNVILTFGDSLICMFLVSPLYIVRNFFYLFYHDDVNKILKSTGWIGAL